MKFEFLFHYRISFVVKPKINPDHAVGSGTVELEIAERTDSQAPVVMRVGNPRNGRYWSHDDDHERFMAKSDGSLREIRVVDGRYYVEDESLADVMANLAAPLTVGKTPFGMVHPVVIHKKGTLNENHETRLVDEVAIPTTIEAIRMRRETNGGFITLREHKTEDDKGKQKRSQLMRLASNMMIVDGKLFVRCREPILALDYFHGTPAIVASPAKVPDLDDKRDHDFPTFGRPYESPVRASLKTADAFYAYIKDAASKDSRIKNSKVRPPFEVVDPTWSRFDGVTLSIAQDLKKLQSELQSNMTVLPRELLEAFFILREADHGSEVDKFIVSPAILQASSLIANYQLPDVSTGKAAALFERLKAERSESSRYNHYGRQDNFTIDAVDKRSEIESIIALAQRIELRWQHRSALTFFDTAASWDMEASFAGKTIREFNSEWQIYEACTVLRVEPTAIIERARAGHRIITISDADGTLVSIAGINRDHQATNLGGSLPNNKVDAAALFYLENEKDYQLEASINSDLVARRA
jgi:hypothetical protein